ncbi:caspase family protein [Maribacter sp. 2304DJ31-5]|uniref:caspase family protein n=1 Tax=Maribacter sp. 2304DJ31-5 TaxID=3386273 RepID=UPI0039BD097C
MKIINFSIFISLLFFLYSCKSSTEKLDLASNSNLDNIVQSEIENPKKYALLVGINKYEYATDLKGCENDIILMENLLINKFGFNEKNIKKLLNENAKRDSIIDSFEDHLLDKVKENDVVVFFYSGHGAQIQNLSVESANEIDKLEEILVAHDFEDSPNKPFKGILDDEINGVLLRLSQITDNVTFILDACNSAGASKSLGSVRRIEAKPRHFDNVKKFAVETRNLRSSDTKFAFFTACKSNQFAYEMKAPNGSMVGAFTYFLTEELSKNKELFSYEDIVGSIRTNVKTRYPFQYPELYGTETNKEVFGVRDLTPVKHARVTSIDGNKIELNIGGIAGATKGSEFEIYSPQEDLRSTYKKTLGKIKLTKVYSDHSEANIMGKHSISAINSKAIETSHSFEGINLKVYCAGNWTDDRKLINAIDHLDFASLSEMPENADLIIRKSIEGFDFYLGNNVEQSKRKFSADTSHENLLNYIEEWASWFAAIEIKNPESQLQIEVNLESEIVNEGSKGLIDLLSNVENTFGVGQSFNLVITNKSDKHIFIHILDIVDTPEVQSLCMADFPNGIELLAPKESVTLELETALNPGVNKTTEIIKVIASVEGEINLNYLTLGCYDGNSKNVKPRKSGKYDINGWAVVDKLIEIKRN